jgi:hypothetical protein
VVVDDGDTNRWPIDLGSNSIKSGLRGTLKNMRFAVISFGVNGMLQLGGYAKYRLISE